MERMMRTSSNDPAIERGVRFLDSLRVNTIRSEYYEVADKDHSEHRVYNQSQYLLSILFKKLGKERLFQSIRQKHRPDEPDNDLPRRRGHIACDRFCVLEGNIQPFYLKNRINSKYSDEKALLAIYWIEKNRPKPVQMLWNQLKSRYDLTKGVLQMDNADKERRLYPVYKVALFGILAKRLNKNDTTKKIEDRLRKWQHHAGGWITDRTIDLKPDGVANIETTVLSIMALLPPKI